MRASIYKEEGMGDIIPCVFTTGGYYVNRLDVAQADYYYVLIYGSWISFIQK